jgi:hypothetical protein
MARPFWLRRLFVSKPPTPAHRPARYRPRLEALEDRTLLNSYLAATAADLINDINLANAAGGANTITLSAAPSSPYTLTAVDNTTDGATGLPVIAAGDNLTIVGNGDTIGASTVSGTPAFRLLDVAAGATLTLQGLTLTNGLASGSGVSAQGGAIYSQGDLTLNGVRVQNNTARGADGASNSGTGGNGGEGLGGAIYVGSGAVTLNNSTLSGNAAQGGRGGDGSAGGNGGDGGGGAIYVNGGASATLINSTLSVNTAQGGVAGSGEQAFGGGGGGGGLYNDGTVTLTNVTFSGNTARGADGTSGDKRGNGANGLGGAIFVGSGAVTLNNSTLSDNAAQGGAGVDGFVAPGFAGDGWGGAIYVNGGANATLINSTLSGNTAQGGVADRKHQGRGNGGGLYNDGTVTLTSVTVSGNSASVFAEGLFNGGMATLTNCTVSSNIGTGLYSTGTATLTNCTISSNTGPGLANSGTATLTNCTISANNNGGVSNSSTATLILGNTIVAGNAGADVTGQFTSLGNNLIGATDSSSGWVSSDLTGTAATPVNPLLNALNSYGGPTQTMALLPGSPAIDAGDSTAPGLPSTDQRGFARISGAAVDIGAYEVQLPTLSPATLADGTYGAAYSQTLTATEEPGGAGGPFTLAVTAGTLPPGLSLDGTSRTLSGTVAAAGSFTFTVTATDSGQYTSSQVYKLTIAKAALTITADSTSKTYGQALTFAGSEFTASGLVNGDSVSSVTLASAGAAASAGVAGSPYALVASTALGSGLGNYTISYVSGALTVSPAALTITADSTSKTYGQALTFAGTEFTASGLVNGDTVTSVTLTSAGAAASAGVAGSPYAIVASAAVGSGLDNYAITYVSGALTVSPAALTITADSTSKTYGQGLTFAGTEFTASGLVNGDTVSSVTLTSAGAAANAGVAGSPYPVAASAAAGSGLGNYTISYVSGALTVSPAALTITAGSTSKTYGQALTFAGTEFTATGLVNGDTVSSVTLSSAGAAASAGVAGSPYAIVASAAMGSSLGNYTISYDGGNLTVNPAAVTITARNETKTYGTTFTPNVGQITASGLVNGDSVTGVTLTCGGYAAAAAVANYAITPGAAAGSGLGNYTIHFAGGTLAVQPAPLPAAGVPFTAIAGVPFSGAVATFTNPDPFAGAASYAALISWGDGSNSAGVVSGSGGTLTVSGSHTYADPADPPVSVQISHNLGYATTATANFTATVNQAPSVSVAFGPAGEVVEVVYSSGALYQFDAAGAHYIGGGVRSASVAFYAGGEVLLVTFPSGALVQYDSAGAHPLANGGIRSASLAFGPAGAIYELVDAAGNLTQVDVSGAHFIGGGFRSASVAYGPSGPVLLLVDLAGNLSQYDASGAHHYGGGVLSAGVAFDASGAEVADVIFQNKALYQFDAAGAHLLGQVP